MAYSITCEWDFHKGQRLPYNKYEKPTTRYYFKNGKIKNRFIKACLKNNFSDFYFLLTSRKVGLIPKRNFFKELSGRHISDVLEFSNRWWWKYHNKKYQGWRKIIKEILFQRRQEVAEYLSQNPLPKRLDVKRYVK